LDVRLTSLVSLLPHFLSFGAKPPSKMDEEDPSGSAPARKKPGPKPKEKPLPKPKGKPGPKPKANKGEQRSC